MYTKSKQKADILEFFLVDGGQPWRTSYGDNLVYTDWKKDNYIQAIKETLGNDAKGELMKCPGL